MVCVLDRPHGAASTKSGRRAAGGGNGVLQRCVGVYNYGLRSQIDVVSAQRTLADARTADVNARTQLLTGLAALAYQTGDLLYAKRP